MNRRFASALAARRRAALRTGLGSSLAAAAFVGPAHAEPDRSLLPADVRVAQETRQRDGAALRFTVIDVARQGDRVVLRFPSFDVSRGEGVQFVQAGPQARLLNRIESAAPTRIDGHVQANGQVYFVNPAGVMFGPSAVVDASSIFAAAGELSEQDFLADRLLVQPRGSVENQGQLRARGAPGVLPEIALVGRAIRNSGALVSPGGRIVLASGDQLYLVEPGSEILISLPQPTLEVPPIGAQPGAPAQLPATPAGLAVGDAYALAVQTGADAATSLDSFAARNAPSIEVRGSVDGRLGARADLGSLHIELPESELHVAALSAKESIQLTTRSAEIAQSVGTDHGSIELNTNLTLTATKARIAASSLEPTQGQLTIRGSVTHAPEQPGLLVLSAGELVRLEPARGSSGPAALHSSDRTIVSARELLAGLADAGAVGLQIESGGTLELPEVTRVAGDAQLRSGDSIRADALLVSGKLSLEAAERIELVPPEFPEHLEAGIVAHSAELSAREVIGLGAARRYTRSGSVAVNGELLPAQRVRDAKELGALILSRERNPEWGLYREQRAARSVNNPPRSLVQPIPDLEIGVLQTPALDAQTLPGRVSCGSAAPVSEHTLASLPDPGTAQADASCAAAQALERARRSYQILVANLAEIQRVIQDEARACRRSSGVPVLDGAQLARCLREQPVSPSAGEYLYALRSLLLALAEAGLGEEEYRQTEQRVLSRIVPEEMTVPALVEAIERAAPTLSTAAAAPHPPTQ